MEQLTQQHLNEKIKAHRLWLEDKGGERADLSDYDLSELNLSDADLRKAILSRARLQWARLGRANLRGADLRGVDFQWASLLAADLQGADLRGADLRGATTWRANLKGAKLEGADLEGVNLETSLGYIKKIEGLEDGWYVLAFPHDWISIGCMTHKLEYWLENYESIGDQEGLDQEAIEEYGEILKSLKGKP